MFYYYVTARAKLTIDTAVAITIIIKITSKLKFSF